MLSGLVVAPNGMETYEFDVPAEVAPLKHNQDCITYMYNSAVDFNKDIHTGLIGPLLVCKDRTLADDGSLVSCVTLLFYSKTVLLFHMELLISCFHVS